MNYIAHIHIGFHTDTSLLGNFLGDFVKGNQLHSLQPHLAEGVLLHRKVDQFTDLHPLVKSLRQLFPASTRRVAGIVIDVVFDHLLMTHWRQFNQHSHQHVLNLFYQQLAGLEDFNTTYLQGLCRSLLAERWLHNYTDRATCKRAFDSIERRLKYKISFADSAYALVEQHFDEFNQQFLRFYPELLRHALHCKHQIRATAKQQVKPWQ